MSEPVIRKEDRPLVEGLEQLMFCNPFLPERTELERELLGPDFVETPHPRHVRTDDPAEDENLSLLVKRAGEAAKRCRARLEEQGVLPEDEIGLYYNLVCFHLYYRYRDSFSDYIELAWKGGGDFGGRFFEVFQGTKNIPSCG